MDTRDKDALLGELKHIYDLVTTWLHFAEAKNGTLVGLNAAVIIALLSHFRDSPPTVAFAWLFLWLFVGALTAAFSFMPNSKPFNNETQQDIEIKNVLLFSEIGALKDNKPYVKELALRMSFSSEISPTPLMTDYAAEILANSRITVKKFKCFQTALWFTVTGPIGALLVALLSRFVQ